MFAAALWPASWSSRSSITSCPTAADSACRSAVTTAIACRPRTWRREDSVSQNIACATACREPLASRSESRLFAAPKLLIGRTASVCILPGDCTGLDASAATASALLAGFSDLDPAILTLRLPAASRTSTRSRTRNDRRRGSRRANRLAGLSLTLVPARVVRSAEHEVAGPRQQPAADVDQHLEVELRRLVAVDGGTKAAEESATVHGAPYSGDRAGRAGLVERAPATMTVATLSHSESSSNWSACTLSVLPHRRSGRPRRPRRRCVVPRAGEDGVRAAAGCDRVRPGAGLDHVRAGRARPPRRRPRCEQARGVDVLDGHERVALGGDVGPAAASLEEVPAERLERSRGNEGARVGDDVEAFPRRRGCRLPSPPASPRVSLPLPPSTKSASPSPTRRSGLPRPKSWSRPLPPLSSSWSWIESDPVEGVVAVLALQAALEVAARRGRVVPVAELRGPTHELAGAGHGAAALLAVSLAFVHRCAGVGEGDRGLGAGDRGGHRQAVGIPTAGHEVREAVPIDRDGAGCERGRRGEQER